MTCPSDFVHRAITLWTLPPGRTPKPYAASAVFYPDGDAVEIAVPRNGGVPHSVLFPRCLLIDGLAEPVEDGDVRIGPRPDVDGWILLALPIDGRPTEFHTERAPVDEFVDATLALIPSDGHRHGSCAWRTARVARSQASRQPPPRLSTRGCVT